ncbi:ABC transporter permease [Clostridium gasigenes]|uniref:ABC transporter permease n=1 Tax=Clostridium gasigenes TaxID=94869 RepID=UPI001C0C71C5|nr:FtsX-like permease family protein [Clostridium gasigenes]MBU3109131.1 FtsX-like permease family protein [Clostridium gasigenes]
MKLSFKIAYRFLKNNKGQTLLIALAIGLGISIQIFLGLLIQNLQNDLVKNTIGGTSHITIRNEDNTLIGNGSELKNNVAETDSRIVTAIETLDQPGLISKYDKSLAVILRGFNLNDGEKIYKFNDKLISGELPSNVNEIIIGKLLAQQLEIESGDEVNLLTPKKDVINVKVTGIIDLKVEALNKNYVVTDLNTIRSIYGLGNDTITSVETQVGNSNIFDVEEISNKIEATVGEKYITPNWIEVNESLLTGLKGQSASSYTIQVFVVLSVIVAIASILAITVMQKTKQIGILKAMGITDKQASRIFIIQGGLLGIIGAIFGLVIGIGLFKTFTVFVKNSDGSSLISGSININFVILSLVIAIVACIISSIIPGRKSLKLNPVEAIKL